MIFSKHIFVRVQPSLKDKMEAAADQAGLTVAEFVRRAIQRKIAESAAASRVSSTDLVQVGNGLQVFRDFSTMSDIVRLPIRRRGIFELENEIHHARIGMVDVIAAQVVTTSGPETWGIVLRSPGEPDTMPCSLQDRGHQGFGQAVGDLASTVEATLLAARARVAALCVGDEPSGVA